MGVYDKCFWVLIGDMDMDRSSNAVLQAVRRLSKHPSRERPSSACESVVWSNSGCLVGRADCAFEQPKEENIVDVVEILDERPGLEGCLIGRSPPASGSVPTDGHLAGILRRYCVLRVPVCSGLEGYW